jgi:hypothetical protein
MVNKSFNLLDEYEITVVDNKVHWVTASEHYPELEDGTYSDQVHTLYHHGEGEVVGRILILYIGYGHESTPGDPSSFHEKLKDLPLWFEPRWVEAPWFIYGGETRIPAVRYTNSGRNVGLAEALYALEMTGYIWNPEIEGFDRKKNEEKTVNILSTAHFQELVKSNDQTLTQ